MRSRPKTLAAALPAVLLLAILAGAGFAEKEAAPPPEARRVLDFTMKRIDGSEQSLSEYEGRVLLLVNVASKCGLTPQYEGLEKLYETKKDEGFAVLGFPANEFAGQEPGSDEQIADFCRSTYGVKFPMFSKIVVKGDGIHPLYEHLTSLPAPLGGEIEWNFQKFLVDREGQVVARFSPRTAPDDPELVAKIDALLAEGE
jgi:glutathione peroxidase